jgi:hypothetical protein
MMAAMKIVRPEFDGRPIIVASLVGTAIFTAVAVAAAIAPKTLGGAAISVDLVLFALGIAAFLSAYAIAIGRSRFDAIGIGGLYFLAGSAPAPVRRLLIGALAVETVVAFATAAARPFSALAFGILVPMFGLGLSGRWGARYGHFNPRDDRGAHAPAPVEQNVDHG